MEEQKLRQLFKNRSNCYVDSVDVVQGMDENCFVETVNEALRLHDVSGRSEQLVDFLKWVGCGYDFENNAEKIVNDYIRKATNCH
jgi:hypothetical protein